MLQDIDILTLLPQRPPFVMVDKLVSCDDTEAVTQFMVREDCLLSDGGRLQPHGLLENIAQTCAARIGYISLQNSDSVGIGVIGSVSGFNVNSLPRTGTLLTTQVVVSNEVFNFTLVSAQITDPEGVVIATAKMKIALLG